MKCQECATPLSGRRRRFCSKRCLDRFYGAQLVPFTCLACACEASAQRRHVAHRKYCSRACYRAHFNSNFLAGQNNGRWRGGRALSYGPEWKKIKAFVRARDGVCRDCGKTPQENGRALDVHHTDPYRFSGSHDLDKLKALCRSCHMRADDHGRRGSARFLRAVGMVRPSTKKSIRRHDALRRRSKQDARRRAQQEHATRLHADGASLREIAREVGVSHQTVKNWLDGFHLAPKVPEQLTLRLPA